MVKQRVESHLRRADCGVRTKGGVAREGSLGAPLTQVRAVDSVWRSFISHFTIDRSTSLVTWVTKWSRVEGCGLSDWGRMSGASLVACLFSCGLKICFNH